MDLRETELGLERYGPTNGGHQSVFDPLEGIFPIEIPARPGTILTIQEFHVAFEHVHFPMHRARESNHCESERIFAQVQHGRGENYEIFSIILFQPSVFVCAVDVALDVGFRRSWCRRKACATYFLKVQALHRGELGFTRYDLANRGRWNVPHAEGSFSDRDSNLIGGAFDDPRVARCS